MIDQPALSGLYFDRISHADTLRRAWEKVQANQGAAGGDGVTVARFALVAEAQIEMLARELKTGRYRPGPARRVYAPKKSGGVRPLDIPCVRDRIAQGAAALVLDAALDPHFEDSSFAYRKGRSVARAVARVAALRRQGFDHVVDGDISAYFERIPHERLIAKLEAHLDDQAAVDLIWLWLETYSLTGRGVPQGSPISPLLANLYLDSVDEKIATGGRRLVRFADDWLILCRSEAAAEGALAKMRDLLAEEGLEINPDKTRVTHFDEGFRFLGHLFVRSLVAREIGDDDTPPEDALAAAEVAAREADEASREAFPDPAPDGRERSDPIFPVYVVEPGKRLEARGARLRVVDDLGRIVDLPPAAIDRIELGPEVEATMAALDLAAANDVEILRVTGLGEVAGRYEPTAPRRATRHLAQARLTLDEAARADLARRLVEGKLRNQRALLRRLNRERKDAEIARACVGVGRIVTKLSIPRSVDESMGFEGAAAALYWPALGRAMPEGLRFSLRRRRPAPDAGNLVINALSSVLARDLRSLALRAGLHPGFGALRAVSDGEEALVYDLMEEFRAPVAEACALALFNRKALRAEMFADGTTQTTLDRGVWSMILRGYETWVSRPVRSQSSGKEVLWRALMLEQARAYAAHCEGGAPYRPYRMDY